MWQIINNKYQYLIDHYVIFMLCTTPSQISNINISTQQDIKIYNVTSFSGKKYSTTLMSKSLVKSVRQSNPFFVHDKFNLFIETYRSQLKFSVKFPGFWVQYLNIDTLYSYTTFCLKTSQIDCNLRNRNSFKEVLYHLIEKTNNFFSICASSINSQTSKLKPSF